MYNNDKWFDEECKNLRKKLRKLSNQKHRNPENLSLRINYGESQKQYRKTPQKKKEHHIRNQPNEIEESIESKHFWENWKTLNKQQHEEPLLHSFWLYNKGKAT